MGVRSRASGLSKDAGTEPQRIEVSLDRLCGPGFMHTHSEFDSFRQFLDESPWTVETHADFEAIPIARLDEYVTEHTTFGSWEAMLSAAGRQWVTQHYDS